MRENQNQDRQNRENRENRNNQDQLRENKNVEFGDEFLDLNVRDHGMQNNPNRNAERNR